jgi:hypothetical protein
MVACIVVEVKADAQELTDVDVPLLFYPDIKGVGNLYCPAEFIVDKLMKAISKISLNGFFRLVKDLFDGLDAFPDCNLERAASVVFFNGVVEEDADGGDLIRLCCHKSLGGAREPPDDAIACLRNAVIVGKIVAKGLAEGDRIVALPVIARNARTDDVKDVEMPLGCRGCGKRIVDDDRLRMGLVGLVTICVKRSDVPCTTRIVANDVSAFILDVVAV